MDKNGLVLKEKNFISAVVYLRNCENSIETFLTEVDQLFHRHFEAYEFVFVNDASEDDTVEKLRGVAHKISGNINVINLAYRHDIETAMLAGVEFAIGDFVYEFDSTLIDYDPEVIMALYHASMEGYDIVAASPKGDISLSSSLFYKYLNKVSKHKMSLKTETFRIVSRRALNRVLRSKEKIRYRKALYHYSGFSTRNIDYDCKTHFKNRNDLSMTDKVSFATDILIGFSDIGTQLSLRISMLFALISLGSILYTIYSYFTVDHIQAGWTTTMMFISVCFTGVFFVLAVISKYITVLLFELQDKPRYIFRSIDRLSRK